MRLTFAIALATLALPALAQDYAEEDLREMEVTDVLLDTATGSTSLVLKEVDGERFIVMGIGPAEATAIAAALEDFAFDRPQTHDLLVRVILTLGADLKRVVITQLLEGAYYARLELERDGEVLAVDCRPSDAAATALRFAAPIYATELVLKQAWESYTVENPEGIEGI
jgi:bifunctional DNase/RNase